MYLIARKKQDTPDDDEPIETEEPDETLPDDPDERVNRILSEDKSTDK